MGREGDGKQRINFMRPYKGKPCYFSVIFNVDA